MPLKALLLIVTGPLLAKPPPLPVLAEAAVLLIRALLVTVNMPTLRMPPPRPVLAVLPLKALLLTVAALLAAT